MIYHAFHGYRKTYKASLILLMFFSVSIALNLAHATTTSQINSSESKIDASPLYIITNKGKQIFNIEIAKTQEEKEKGLMYRKGLPTNNAMLFIFPTAQVITMWMKDTLVGLDIIFADETGKIISIYPNAKPNSFNMINSKYPASYVIEINAGQAKNKDIEIGQTLIHPVICGSCKI